MYINKATGKNLPFWLDISSIQCKNSQTLNTLWPNVKSDLMGGKY